MKKNEFSLRKRIKDGIPFYIMLSPFYILFLLFTIIPVVASVFLSLTDFNMMQMPSFVGISNFVKLFLEDEIFLKAIKNTLIFAVVTGPIGYLLSFVVAWFINDLSPIPKNIVTLLMYSPALCGSMISIWMYIFAADTKGLMNSLLMNLGIIRAPIAYLTDTRYNFIICVVVIIWSSMGVGFLSLLSGLKALDKAYFEAGAIDGISNRWQELYYVTLPQIGPQLIFSAVMTISSSFPVGGAVASLTGFPSTDYSTHTIILHMTDYATTRFEMGYASAIAVVLFGIMLGSWIVISKMLRGISGD